MMILERAVNVDHYIASDQQLRRNLDEFVNHESCRGQNVYCDVRYTLECAIYCELPIRRLLF